LEHAHKKSGAFREDASPIPFTDKAHTAAEAGIVMSAGSDTLGSAVPRRDIPQVALAERYAGFVVAIALHVALIIALLQYEPARRAIETVAPIMVSLITPVKLERPPPPPEQPRPVVQPPRPQTVQKPVEQPPIIARPPEEPPSHVPPPPEPVPAPAIEPPVQPEAPPPVEHVAVAEPVAPMQAVARADPAPAVEPAAKPDPLPPDPITPPRFNADYLHNPAPSYPPLSRRMGEQGRVILRVLVSTDGVAERIELKNSSGSRRLDQAALDTVKQWKFVPARQGDLKVPAWVLVPILFTLQG